MSIFNSHPNERDLALFAGGELGPLSRWRIERHLESCAACKAEAAAYFHLPEKLSELAELPDMDWTTFARNIRAAAAQASDNRPATPSFGRLWKACAAAAAAACLPAAIWAVLEYRSRPADLRAEAAAPFESRTEEAAKEQERPLLPETAAISGAADAPAEHDVLSTTAFDEWSSPDAQITAEGRLSLRRFDAVSGAMTITEYYAP